MSYNAIYNRAAYHIVEVQGHEVELKPVDETQGDPSGST